MLERIGNLGRTYRHIQRYTEILGVMITFGFEDLVTTLKLEQYVDAGRRMIFRKRKERVMHHGRAVRIRMALEELGPTFIKLGQMLSTRPDILPSEFIDELIKLQDEVPPFEFSEAKRILETELQKPMDEVFAEFDQQPLAAASIGQVHRGRLVTGEEVAVKVQRPNIHKTVEVDLEILMHLAGVAEKRVGDWNVQKPTDLVEEFGRQIELEMDYGVEAANMEHFRRDLEDDPGVYVPRVFRRSTTPRVLTMEFMRGVRAGCFDELREAGYDLKAIADIGADQVLTQTLITGFFHADPHPGNLLIQPGPVICFLDMGMMGRLDRTTREHIADLVLGVVRRDPETMTRALLRLTIWEDEPDRRALGRELTQFIDQYLSRPLKEVQLGRMLEHVFETATKYKLRVMPDMLLSIRALTITEGLGRQLDPDFDIITKAKPFIERLHMARYNPIRIVSDLKDYTAEVLHILKVGPSELRYLLRLLRQGRLKIELDHRGLESLRVTHERSVNRLSFAIVLAALIIGSSLVIHAGIPPTWHDVPILGLIGYILAAVMGFWLLVTIIRRGMM